MRILISLTGVSIYYKMIYFALKFLFESPNNDRLLAVK